jgi:hypothetical protein
MASLGDTIILPKPGAEKEHLWVVVTKPEPATGEVIMVNLTTRRPHSDTTTVLLPGEHPFIDRPTVAFYPDAWLAKAALLDSSIAQGVGRNHAVASPALLVKLQNGLMASPFTPAKIQSALAAAKAAGLA